MSNLFDKDSGRKPIVGMLPYHVLESQGFKIGFLGFAEPDWLDCLNAFNDASKMEYVDYNEILKDYQKTLREEQNCDLVVAINHMRVPDDQKMAADNDHSVVDLIFGGHDHTYFIELN